jgi:hypothetical protein
MTPEPFVSAEEAVKYVPVTRRYLLVLARRGIAGAYPLDPEARRKRWVFRLSELVAAIAGIPSSEVIQSKTNRDRIRSAVSRA